MPDEDTQVLDGATLVEDTPLEADDESQIEAPPLQDDGEIDYKSLADRRSEELANERLAHQRTRTRLGRYEPKREGERSSSAIRREIDLAIKPLEQYVSLLVKQQADPDADPDQFRQEVATVNTETELQGLVGEASGILARIADRAADMETDITGESFANARNQWEQARQVWASGNVQEAMRGFYRADAAYQLALDRLQVQQEADDQRKSKVNQQRRNGTLNVAPGSSGTAGGMTAEQRWSAYGRGEVSWSKEVQDAGRALGAL